MAEMQMMTAFKIMIVVMMFYSVSITLIAYALPGDSKPYVTGFSDLSEDIDLNSTSSKIQESVQSQSSLPIIEIGAMVFYSGNILLDLLLNFAFAIPEMIALLINGLLLLLDIDSYIVNVVQLFVAAVTMALYAIGLIQLITNVRSGRVV